MKQRSEKVKVKQMKKHKKDIRIKLKKGHEVVDKIVSTKDSQRSIMTSTITGRICVEPDGTYHLHPRGRKGYYTINPENVSELKIVE